MLWFELFFLLIVGHFVADYALQSDTMAKYKNFNNHMEGVPWYYWMMGHAATHALVIYLITGNIWCCIIELMLHYIIDYGKCAKKYGIHSDQFLHSLCRILYLFYMVGF